MRKITLVFLIAALSLMMFSCTAAGTVIAPPADTAAPEVSPGPAAEPEPAIPEPVISEDGTYTIETHILCFPEGSDIESADHVLIYALPVFSGGVYASDAFNASVGLYEEELIARITEQLTDAEGEPPTTYVNVEVTKVRGLTNILFTEETKSGAETSAHRYAIVLSQSGNEMSLAELTGMYDADVLISQLIWNRIDAESANTFTGITQESVYDALDIYNGFYVTESGYAVFFDAGALFEADKGQKTYELRETDIYPSFVGDVLSVDSYRELLPVFSRLAAATLVNFESFDTAPTPYVATAFIADTLSSAASPEVYGTELQLTREDMNELFSSYFNAEEYPGCDSAVRTVKEENGVYTVLITEGFHPFSIEFTDARQEDNTVVLTGNIMYGTPGMQDANFVSGIIITLVPAQNAAAGGYVIQSWMITK
jgi:hypothetical protein